MHRVLAAFPQIRRPRCRWAFRRRRPRPRTRSRSAARRPSCARQPRHARRGGSSLGRVSDDNAASAEVLHIAQLGSQAH